jgi:methylase of polypeptide subunit release factors
MEQRGSTSAELSVTDADGIAALREALAASGYTEHAVQEALATEVASSRDSLELPLYSRLLPRGERIAALAKLFLLGLPVSRAEAEAALAPIGSERLQAMGVVRVDGGEVRGELELVPVGDLVIACDPFLEELTRPDHVLGVSPPTKALAALTVRPRVETALDLCTGNGIQALLAARHAQHVVGADVNERALRFARFNALLNGAPEIELRQGDLFDPIAGEAFDLVVCNPPYVISPETEFVYRDSGIRGDAFCESIVRRLPEHLRDGGFAHVLVSWTHPTEGDWSEPLREWVDGNGCDVLLLQYATHEPLQYAAGWNRPLRADSTAYAAALDRWSEYFERLGIEAISWGAVIMRRRAGTNWVWAYSPSAQRVAAAGDHVLRLFASQDLLHAGDDALLDHPLVLAEDHRLEQTSRLAPDGREIESTVLRLADGLRFAVAVDLATEDVLQLLDGRPLRAVLAEASELLPPGIEDGEFQARALAAIRRLVELGFLVSGNDPAILRR